MARLAYHGGVQPSEVEGGVLTERGFVALAKEIEELREADRKFWVELTSGVTKAIVESASGIIKQVAATIPRRG